VLAGTEEMGLTWDETLAYLRGSDIFLEWVSQVQQRILAGQWASIWEPAFHHKYWPLMTPENQGFFHFNGHPPLTRFFPTITWYLFHNWLGDIPSYRLASAIMFSSSVMVLFRVMSREFDYSTGLFSALSLLVMPRVFGHAHIAATGTTLSAFWLFSAIAFYKGLEDKRWSYGFAVLLGLAFSTKFTACLIPLALILYMVLAGETRGWRNIAVSFFISPAILFLLNPTWWVGPLSNFWNHYVVASLTRNEYTFMDNYYLGQTYLVGTPWHHPFVMTAVTVPPVILLFALAGGILNLKRLNNKVILLFLSQLIFYYFVLLLPMTPHNDGVRLFIAVFPFLACFAGLGFERAREWIFSNRFPARLARFGKERIIVLIFAIVFFLPGVNLAAMHPYYLEYYNSLVGGVAGAHRLGFETTYWFGTMTPSVRQRINQLPPGSKVGIHPPIFTYYHYLQAKGLLDVDLKFTNEEMDYFILLPRKGRFKPDHWQLYWNQEPYYKVELEGVPMFLVYQIEK